MKPQIAMCNETINDIYVYTSAFKKISFSFHHAMYVCGVGFHSTQQKLQ